MLRGARPVVEGRLSAVVGREVPWWVAMVPGGVTSYRVGGQRSLVGGHSSLVGREVPWWVEKFPGG